MGIITTCPEILLSLIILILVLYGINFSIFKISVVTLVLILWGLIQLWMGILYVSDKKGYQSDLFKWIYTFSEGLPSLFLSRLSLYLAMNV